MSTRLAFVGDTHGDEKGAIALLLFKQPDVVIHVGDFDANTPISERFAALTENNMAFLWIHGNHDVDREHWFDNTLGSTWQHRHIDGQVRSCHGIRIAGLGGHFVERIWHPERGAPRFASREHYLASCPKSNLWRGGLPRKVRGAIWWEDIERLWDQRADVLVLHEAPAPHDKGHQILADLAEAMEVKLIVHGHHHEHSQYETDAGIPVVGLGLCETHIIAW